MLLVEPDVVIFAFAGAELIDKVGVLLDGVINWVYSNKFRH